MATSKFGIVLLPDKETENYVRLLATDEDDNQLPPGFIVHLSLLHIVIKEITVLPNICSFLDDIKIPRNREITCHWIRRGNGWSFLEAVRTNLVDLHQKVLPIAKLEDKKSGYPVGEKWIPHFTFAKTNRLHPTVTLSPSPWNGTIRAIAIGRVGEYGSITETIYTKSLLP